MYFSHNSNIKYAGFEPIHYAINIDVISSSVVLEILIICFYRCITSLNQ